MATRTSWKTAFPALLAHPGLSDYDRRVVEDMKRGYDRKGASYMTAGRRRYFHGIADRCRYGGSHWSGAYRTR